MGYDRSVVVKDKSVSVAVDLNTLNGLLDVCKRKIQAQDIVGICKSLADRDDDISRLCINIRRYDSGWPPAATASLYQSLVSGRNRPAESSRHRQHNCR